MRIAIIHNAYLERGGEDAVVDNEQHLLKARGHEVLLVRFDNSEIRTVFDRATTALHIANNPSSARRLRAAVDGFRPDIVHVHNFFPLVTPGAIGALAREGVPIVQTLHNFRAICPGGLLMREGRPCEDCLGVAKWPAIRQKCYRGSVLGSAAVVQMGRVFRRVVDRFPNLITLIALTHFAKSRFLADGFGDRIIVRPNFAPDTGAGPTTRDKRLLYVGRVSEEKGVETLIRAAANLDAVVEIVGDGPEFRRLVAMSPSNVIFTGRLPPAQVAQKMRSASALLVPSRCYEGFPMITIEAMASGTPIIASRIGSLAEIVQDQVNGRLLPPLDVDIWAQVMKETLGDLGGLARWGQAARRIYETSYNQEAGYESLITIYNRAIAMAKACGNERADP